MENPATSAPGVPHFHFQRPPLDMRGAVAGGMRHVGQKESHKFKQQTYTISLWYVLPSQRATPWCWCPYERRLADFHKGKDILTTYIEVYIYIHTHTHIYIYIYTLTSSTKCRYTFAHLRVQMPNLELVVNQVLHHFSLPKVDKDVNVLILDPFPECT